MIFKLLIRILLDNSLEFIELDVAMFFCGDWIDWRVLALLFLLQRAFGFALLTRVWFNAFLDSSGARSQVKRHFMSSNTWIFATDWDLSISHAWVIRDLAQSLSFGSLTSNRVPLRVWVNTTQLDTQVISLGLADRGSNRWLSLDTGRWGFTVWIWDWGSM